MTKLTLPLEVGKKYVCRDGTIVECHAKAGAMLAFSHEAV